LSLLSDYVRFKILSLTSDFSVFKVSTMKKIAFDLDIHSYQIDCIGHVHNAVYVNWMEIGRLKILDAIGLPITTLISQGSFPALAQTTITYKTPLFLSNRVWIEMWLSSLGYSSVVMRFQFFNASSNTKSGQEQVMAAEGYQRSMFVDKDSWKIKRFTREEKDAFLPYVEVQAMDTVDLLPKSPRMRVAVSRSNK
jgi:acyl-CoA thioester hydrolase